MVREFLKLTHEEFRPRDHSFDVAVPSPSEGPSFIPRAEHVDFLVPDRTTWGRSWITSDFVDPTSLPGLTHQDIVRIARRTTGFGAEIVSVAADNGTGGAE